MPSYKLTYFTLRGRGEHLRLMFLYAGVPFEDCRVTREDWKSVKPTTPFGQLPVLEVDGVPFEQSQALARYLAGQLGLGGRDAAERLQSDIFACHIEDLMRQIDAARKEPDPARGKAMMTHLRENVFPAVFQRLDKRVAVNGFSVCDEILWSDILLASVVDSLMIVENVGEDFATKYPNLMRVKNTVFKNPRVKAYIDKRPPTAY